MQNWEASYVAGIIDGEGSITLTRMHTKEHRRPCITIPSTDKELLLYIQSLTGGTIINKKNYNPKKHKDSYTLNITKKNEVFPVLQQVSSFLRVDKKRLRAQWILDHYDSVTIRNGKYKPEELGKKWPLRMNFLIYNKKQTYQNWQVCLHLYLPPTLCMVETEGRADPYFRYGTDYILNPQTTQVPWRLMRNIYLPDVRQNFAS
jgi:hypothetical protein